MSRWWSKLGAVVTRLPVAIGLFAVAIALLVQQLAFLDDHMAIKVEANDLLPTDHPKNAEFQFLRDHFSGSSRGFFVVVEAPLPRLREVVPRIADRYRTMPKVEFVRWRVEREFFEDHILLFQSQEHLERQLAHVTKNRHDLEVIVGHTGSLAELLNGVANIIEGEQSDLGEEEVDEREKDDKLTQDLKSLEPLLVFVPAALSRIAGGQHLDPRALGAPLSDLLLRGWYDREDLERLDRELLVPDDVFSHGSEPTLAVIWIATAGSDYSAEFTGHFLDEANRARDELALELPDVKLHFTGGIASYRKYLDTVTEDTDTANAWGLLSVFLLLVLGFRALSPFALTMLLLIVGTSGALVFQNLVFGGVNMIATAGTLAVIGIGSDYAVIFISTQRALFAEAVRAAPPGRAERPRTRLEMLRGSIRGALAKIGTPTTAGAIVSAAGFLALAGSELVPILRSIFGLSPATPESFQPIRELALGGAFGLIYCLVLMLVALPAMLYVTEWVVVSKPMRRLKRLRWPLRRKLSRNRAWLRLKGRVSKSWRTDYERRWFRSLAQWSVRWRFHVIGVTTLIAVAALFVATNVEWSTGQRDVEPIDSPPILVSERVEEVFGKSFENVMIFGPLDDMRRVHEALDRRREQPSANIADVISIDDYLPARNEPQPAKLAIVRELDEALADLRPELPAGLVVWTAAQQERLKQALTTRREALLALSAEGETRRALARVAEALTTLVAALEPGEALAPAADWARELVPVEREVAASTAGGLGEIAGEPWLIAGARSEAVARLKTLGRELVASVELGDGLIFRRDLDALALALAEVSIDPGGDCRRAAVTTEDPCRLATLGAVADRLRAWARAEAGAVKGYGDRIATVARPPLEAAVLVVDKFIADSAIYEMELGGDFGRVRDALEQSIDAVRLRLRPRRLRAVGISPLMEAAYRLRRSLDTLRSFAASSSYARVEQAIPTTAAAADGLIASLHALNASAGPRADAIVGSFDAALTQEIFDRFRVVRKAAATIRAPLTVNDVPVSALEIFRGNGPAANLYLARVQPRVSMLQRQPFEQVRDTIEQSMAVLPEPSPEELRGYSGFEVLLNLATDYLEGTFVASMIAICILALLVVLLLFKSLVAMWVTVTPVILGTLLTLALMVIADIPISIFTVIAIPIVIGVGIDSAILSFNGYWADLSKKGRRPVEEALGPSGKAVTLNILTTTIPFAVLVTGDMKGLIAVGFILALGTLACYFAQLFMMPASISVVQDFVVPASQYATCLWPRRWVSRIFRFLLGRWQRTLPFNDSGIALEHHGGVVVATMRRPPLNLIDAASVAKATEYTRAMLRDPDVRAMIWHSGLPGYFHVANEDGTLVEDERGRPLRVAAARAHQHPLEPGQKLEGPMRLLGGGADLKLMAGDLVNAFFTLKGAGEYASAAWYSPKPVIYIAEGDAVAGSMEIALYANYFLVTRNARIGAPEVKRGLTLPFGSHALQFRAGTQVAQQLMASGELISGEEAVRLGIADALVPDGEDPVEYALRLAVTREFRDAVHQTALLRQYGPPMKRLIARSVANYVRLMRKPETRARVKKYAGAVQEETV